MTKNILISGGAGFLGSHLCDEYVKSANVVCLDNLSTGSKTNIEHLLKLKNFTFLEVDITKELPLELLNTPFDIVVNLASPASPPHYQRLALETLEVGSVGTKNMLDIAKQHNSRFFQASTSEVYGDPEVHPQTEEYKGSVNCYGPRSMYDESKRYAESLVYVYRKKFNVNTVVARFFNTYGPRMDKNDGRVVSNLINQAVKNQNLTVYGKGNQTRSFCYVDDLIEAIIKLIDSDIEGPINLGNPNEFTILQLAEIIKDLIPGNFSIRFKPLPQDDPMQRKPDITKAITLLDWYPKIELREGLIRTTQYFESKN